MIRNWFLAGAAALGATAAAQAEVHSVVVTGFSYFPAVVYAQPGDTILFVNESGEEQTVVGKDAGWVIGPLQNLAEGTLLVDQETELAFYSAYQEPTAAGEDDEIPAADEESEPDYGSYENAPIKAEITFDPPPLDD